MILPKHPHPQPGELLSSWLYRLAQANTYKPHTFYNKVLCYKGAIWNIDIDRHPAEKLLRLLSAKSGQPVERLIGLSLGAYEGYLFESLRRHGNSRGLLSLGLYHRQRLRAGLQYCPLCLSGGIVPYYRRHWRLAVFALCERHSCCLLDRCTACDFPVMFHRNGVGRQQEILRRGLQLCFHCGVDLCHAVSTFPSTLPSDAVAAYHRLISDISSEAPTSHLFPGSSMLAIVQGLYIITVVLTGRNGKRLREVISLDMSIPMPLGIQQHMEFEYREASERVVILSAVAWMLCDWPHRFLDLCTRANLTRSAFFDHLTAMPYWLSVVVNGYLDRRPYRPDEEEIAAAFRYLAELGEPPHYTTLAVTMGISRDVAKAATRWWLARGAMDMESVDSPN